MSSSLERAYAHLPPSLQSLALTAYGWRLKRMRRGPIYTRWSQTLRSLESRSAEEVTAIHEAALVAAVRHAATHVPYHRDRFAELGMRPEDFSSIADLERLPFMDKSAVQERGLDLVSDAVRRRRLQSSSSGGTTGSSTTYYIDPQGNAATYATFHSLQWRWAGVAPGDPWVMINGRKVVPIAQTDAPFWRLNRADNEHFLSCFHIRPDTIPTYLDHLRDIQPVLLHLYPSTADVLARYVLDHDLVGLVSPRAIITTSETLFPDVRHRVETAFCTRVFNHYTGDYSAQICQCEQGTMHVAPLYGHVEFHPIPNADIPGLCEMVVTTMANRGTMLLRYRIGDTAVPSHAPCACGRPFPSVEQLHGRTGDVVRSASGAVINASNLTDVFKSTPNIRRCQFVQERPAELLARMEVRPGFGPNDEADFRDEVLARTGADMDLRIEIVDEIELTSSGKFRFVISEL